MGTESSVNLDITELGIIVATVVTIGDSMSTEGLTEGSLFEARVSAIGGSVADTARAGEPF